MDLHLDDRLLHGRILHGWLPVLKPTRIVLVARGLADSPRALLYAASAAELGLPLVCCELADAQLPAPRPGDFWLTDAPPALESLPRVGIEIKGLVIIGLREAGGQPLAEDFTPAAESLAALLQLAEGGLIVRCQRFPNEPAIPVAVLARGAGSRGGARPWPPSSSASTIISPWAISIT